MKLYAHRGVMASYPENTMSAFRAAIDAEADGIEADVHMTKDGELVLIHDETIDRTTDGHGQIAMMRLSELRRVNAGVKFDITERIPTLEELLELCQGTSLRLNVEVKTDIERYPGIEERLQAAIVNQHFPAEQIVFSSFNHATLKRLNELEPEIECALLLAQPLYDLEHYARRMGATAIHPSVRTLTDQEIISLQQTGLVIRPYTVKTADQLERFRRLGVDAVFVNDIEWAKTYQTP